MGRNKIPELGLVAQENIDQGARMLLDAAPEGSEVILFGSHARGDANAHSDVDFMVVEPEVTDAWRESVRLRRRLAAVPMSMDIIVVSRDRFEGSRTALNSLIGKGAREGKVYARTT